MALRIAFAIHTPGQAHLWHNVIRELVSDGHEVFVVSRGGGITEQLLSAYNIKYSSYGVGGRGVYSKLLKLPGQFFSTFKLISRFKPDILVGTGLLEAHTSALLHKPCIIFEDTELTPTLERKQWLITANKIITPACLKRDLGKKQVRVQSFKELAYLHPNHFIPDESIFRELNIEPGEKYAVIRFNSFAALHDIKVHGFSVEEKYQVVRELGKHLKVFVAAEGALPGDLETYRLPTQPSRIHHVLNYAQIAIGDSGTMIVESAILGTPGIMLESKADLFGNALELEKKYGLIYIITDPQKAIIKATELVQLPCLKEQWAAKRERLLKDKIDMAQFFVNYIEKYRKD